MSNLTRTTYAPGALAPAADLWADSKPLSVPLADGGQLTVRLEDDTDSDLADFGRLEWTRDRNRPTGFDGGAVKVLTRSGYLWFQPDPEFTPEYRPRAIERVRDYYLEHWSYVGVVVTRHAPPIVGPFGNDLTDSATEALWGLESDAGDYLAAMARELAAELGCDPA